MRGYAVWLTGLPCSGKTTLATEVERRLSRFGRLVKVFDGDAIRATVSADLGFSREDRDEQVRRVTERALWEVRHGTVVIVSLVSPYAEARRRARERVEAHGTFIEVYVRCPKEVCRERDTKGMWAKAERGEIKGFTGHDDPYEEPTNPDVVVDTDSMSEWQCGAAVISKVYEAITGDM